MRYDSESKVLVYKELVETYEEWLQTENEGLDGEESSWILAKRILPLI